MSDRKKLKEELNKLMTGYQDYDLQLRKAGASIEQRQQLRDMMNQKRKQLITELGDDLQNLNIGKEIKFPGAAKEAAEKTGKKVLKKIAGIIPLMGAGAALVQGDPAMAAEELAYDAMGPAGVVAEALKPTETGNVEEENQMLAERNAQRKYDKSPAAMDAAKSRGETLPKLRKAIGPERLQALTGMDSSKIKEQELLNDSLKQAGQDEEKIKELKRRVMLMGGTGNNE